MALSRHPFALVALTGALAASHTLMAALHVIGRAVPPVQPIPRSPLDAAAIMADGPLWVVMHGVAAAGIVATLTARRWRALAAFWSVSVWVIWCVLLLLWAARTDHVPVSLAPLVTLTLAVPVARVVAGAWTQTEARDETAGR